jgi:protein ImuA
MFFPQPRSYQGFTGHGLHLEGGLRGSAVHEFRAPEGTAAHVMVAVTQLAVLQKTIPILWVSQKPLAYAPGLAWLGLDPARCLFAQARDDAQSLGTLETGLRGGMAGVAECVAVSRLAARRLALAAKTGGGIGFLLRHAPAFTPQDSTAFATRWMISPVPGGRLRAVLLYAKGGQPGEFMYEIREVNHAAAPPALTLVEQTGQTRRTG